MSRKRFYIIAGFLKDLNDGTFVTDDDMRCELWWELYDLFHAGRDSVKTAVEHWKEKADLGELTEEEFQSVLDEEVVEG